jgi:hypothetical protein
MVTNFFKNQGATDTGSGRRLFNRVGKFLVHSVLAVVHSDIPERYSRYRTTKLFWILGLTGPSSHANPQGVVFAPA